MLTLLAIFYFLIPLLILYLCHRFKFVNKIGAVVVAYITGVILGNIGLLPSGSQELQNALSTITIPLAIPLMLFSTNLKAVKSLARSSFASLLVGLVSVTVMITSGFFVFGEYIPEAWKVGGLLVGVYTGGTPNLASLKLILDVDETMYLTTHSADLVIGVFYLFFLLSFGQRIFSKLLPAFAPVISEGKGSIPDNTNDVYWDMFQRRFAVPLIKAVLLAILVVGISLVVSLVFPSNAQMAVIMLLITTLSLGLSFVPLVNRLPKTFELGMYFVLVFSVVVASMANVANLISGALHVLYYVAWVVFGSLVLQVLVSRILKIDADTVIITSTALICSPPFVPVIAGALNNRNLIVPGLSIGIIGYTLGNYLGFLIAHLLK